MRKLISYYLPFDDEMAFSLPLVWENGKRYAYRHGIACVALGTVTVAADVSAMPVIASVTFGLTCVTSLVGSICAGAAMDAR